MIGWHWTGKESRTESSRGLYQLVRVGSNIFIGLWLLMIPAAGFQGGGSLSGEWLAAIFAGPFLTMGIVFWGLRYLVYRYVSHVKITPEGLAVTRGASSTIHPWSAIGEIRTVPFVQPALWRITFRSGAPSIAFFTEGSSWMILGMVKAKSKFVDEVRRLTGEAGPPI